MKNNYKKILLILIIVLLIIILVSTILLINYKKNNVNKNEITIIKDSETVIEQLNEEVIIPYNSYLFFGKYINGEVSSNTIYESIYKFAKDILPKYHKDLKNSNTEEIAKYYSANKKSIYQYMNIKNSEEFVNFIKLIQSLKTDELTLESMEFIEDGMNYSNTSTYSKFAIKYKDNEKITINIKVYKLLQEDNRNVVFY